MSEILFGKNQRLEGLCDFARQIADGKNGRKPVDDYRHLTSTVTPEETMKVIDFLLRTGYSTALVKGSVGKILNVFHESLKAASWEKPGEGHFLHYLMLENRQAELLMAKIRGVTKTIFSDAAGNHDAEYNELLAHIKKLRDYNLHYIKKENILFPYIEKTFPEYRCLQVMWSFHDDFRKCLKNLEDILSGAPDTGRLNREIGKLFFTVLPIIFREEQIVFPVALKAIPGKDWDEMLVQSLDSGWCFGVSPLTANGKTEMNISDALNDLGTGSLSPEQIIIMLNALPVDITFVDENDEVRYFSDGGERIFPRSKAIIGRKVQNCHPPESLHVVNNIISSFRLGKKDSAEFWITMKGRFLHIRYFALRDKAGNYRGVLEVSQDVTGIRNLQGEKRLLD